MPGRPLIKKNPIFDECANIKSVSPEHHVDENVYKQIAANFRTLPTFEKSLYEQVRMKHCSLQKNEKLRCCWQKYKEHMEAKVFTPFHFPDTRDLHYQKYAIEFVPSENKYKFDNRKKLKPGPGVDAFGQMPIPQELLMRRSGDLKEVAEKDLIKKKSSKKQTKK